MLIAVIVLSLCLAAAILYIISLRRQIKNVNRQLKARLAEKSSQAIHIDLLDNELNALSSNINGALESEKQLRIKAQKDERLFRELIANVSHDMRTPLTAVKGYLQILEGADFTSDDRESYDMAMKYVDVMQGRVEQFFEYSYYVSREEQPELCNINLTNEVVECILELIPSYETAGRKNIFEREAPAMIKANATMLRRVIQNLLSNSLHHSDGDTRVSICEERGKNALVVSNRVNPSDNIDVRRIFDRFYTVSVARTVSSGLGLSIVKLLAEKMCATASARMSGDILEILVEFEKPD